MALVQLVLGGPKDEHGKAAAGPRLEKLPSDVMVRVQEFLELPGRVQCAASSKTLRKLIYKDCTPLWHHIDFSQEVCYPKNQALTDEQLSSLLLRVHAKTVTKSLNLERCCTLQGTGLECLSGSQVLEKLDIHYMDGDRLSLDIVVPILRTMIPYKLSFVRHRQGHQQENVPEVFKSFLRDLKAARVGEARQQKIKCGECTRNIVNESMQLVLGACGGPNPRCGSCRQHFCRHGSCSMGLVDCQECGDTSCSNCAKFMRCKLCNGVCCDPCSLFVSSTCDACQTDLCNDCFYYSSLGDTCVVCFKNLCGQCRTNGSAAAIELCEGCWDSYCSDCRHVFFCHRCGRNLCVDCTDFNFLDCCDALICEECVTPELCMQCERKFCGLDTCDLCNETLCDDCSEVKQCGTCLGRFCSKCRDVNFFHCSPDLHCSSCVIPRQCDACLKKFRDDKLAKCGECNTLLCAQCRSEQCDSCCKAFCSDHCAFITTCEECETSYCAACADIAHCSSCGVSSCESCKRINGSSCSCKDRPSKRPRLSR